MSDSLWPHGLQHAGLPCPSVSRSLLKLVSLESVIPSNHLILCRPLSFCPWSFPASGSFLKSWHLIFPSNIFMLNLESNLPHRGLMHYGNWTLLSDKSQKHNKWKILTLFPIFGIGSFSVIALFTLWKTALSHLVRHCGWNGEGFQGGAACFGSVCPSNANSSVCWKLSPTNSKSEHLSINLVGNCSFSLISTHQAWAQKLNAYTLR